MCKYNRRQGVGRKDRRFYAEFLEGTEVIEKSTKSRFLASARNERHGETFLRRVYAAAEREHCERLRNKYERYAGRFAAKAAARSQLFFAEGYYWIYAGGAPGGDDGSGEGDGGQKGGYGAEGGSIGGAYAE